MGTLNQYISWPCKLFNTQALLYFAVCRGEEVGFVQLFHELKRYISDSRRRWNMCCRVKRGMTDTSMPGAFFKEQVYFKGIVEILRELEKLDVQALYGGQIALADLETLCGSMEKKQILLPHFLKTEAKRKEYLEHCRELIRENGLSGAVGRKQPRRQLIH